MTKVVYFPAFAVSTLALVPVNTRLDPMSQGLLPKRFARRIGGFNETGIMHRLRPGGGLFIYQQLSQHNGTIEFHDCSSKEVGVEPQGQDETRAEVLPDGLHLKGYCNIIAFDASGSWFDAQKASSPWDSCGGGM